MSYDEFQEILSKEGIDLDHICKGISYFDSYAIDKRENIAYGFGKCIPYEQTFMFEIDEDIIYLYTDNELRRKVIAGYVIGILKTILPDYLTVSVDDEDLPVCLQIIFNKNS
jgi:hypothetical protein